MASGITDSSLHYHLENANLAIEVPGEHTSNEWLEPVDDTAYPTL